MLNEDNAESGETQVCAEEIEPSRSLEILWPVAYPPLRLEYYAPVKKVWPCPRCEAGIARVSFNGEVRIVDAIYNRENSQPFARKWNANVLHEHECGCDQ